MLEGALGVAQGLLGPALRRPQAEEAEVGVGLPDPVTGVPEQAQRLLAASLPADRKQVLDQYQAALALQLVWLLLAGAGRLRLPIPGAGLAYYYLVVTWATLAGLARYVRFGPPLLWERIEGTR